MSKLISGKEAKQAWASGETVQIKCVGGFFDLAEHRELLNVFDNPENMFRLKPKTITLNGIEVPAPFEPEDGDTVWVLSDMHNNGYMASKHKDGFCYEFGAWRTEDEIKQVVSALRSIFNK